MSAVSGHLNPSSIAPVRADILSKPGKAEGKIRGKVSLGHVYIQDTGQSFSYITLNALNKFPRFKGAVSSLLTRHFTPIHIQNSTGDTKTILVKTSTVAKFLGVHQKDIQKKSGEEITNMVSKKQQNLAEESIQQPLINQRNKGLSLASEKGFVNFQRSLLLDGELGKLENGIRVVNEGAEAAVEEKIKEFKTQYQELPPEHFVDNLGDFKAAISSHVQSWKEEAANSPTSSTIKEIEYQYKEGKTIKVEVLITPGGRLIAQVPNSGFARGSFKQVSLGVDLETGKLMAYQHLKAGEKKIDEKDNKTPIDNEQKIMERAKEKSGIATVAATAHVEEPSGKVTYRIVQDLYTSGSLLDQTKTLSPEVRENPTLKAAHMKEQETNAIPMMLKAAKGLHNFHTQTGCVHRDLKLENFLFSDQQVFLTDFDQMTEVANLKPNQVGTLLGAATPPYSPPMPPDPKIIKDAMTVDEQTRKEYGQATDVYSFGMMMFAAILGKDKEGHEEIVVDYSAAKMSAAASPQHIKDARKADLEKIHAQIPEGYSLSKIS